MVSSIINWSLIYQDPIDLSSLYTHCPNLLTPPRRPIGVFCYYDTIDFSPLPTAFSTKSHSLEYFANMYCVSNRHDTLPKLPPTEYAVLPTNMFGEHPDGKFSGSFSENAKMHAIIRTAPGIWAVLLHKQKGKTSRQEGASTPAWEATASGAQARYNYGAWICSE